MPSVAEQAGRVGVLLPQIAKNLRFPALIDSVRRGLTSSQLLTLLLVDQGRGPRMSMGEIAEELGVSLPTATGLVDRLVRGGLLNRQVSDEDRRVVLVALMPDGRALIRRVLEVIDDLLVKLLSNMSEGEQESLAQAAERLFDLSLMIRGEERRRVALPQGTTSA